MLWRVAYGGLGAKGWGLDGGDCGLRTVDSSLPREWRGAFPAELETGRILKPAPRTTIAERSRAFSAEFHPPGVFESAPRAPHTQSFRWFWLQLFIPLSGPAADENPFTPRAANGTPDCGLT